MPLFLKVTTIDDSVHYVNFFWVDAFSILEDKETGTSMTQLLLTGSDEPIFIKETPETILKMIDKEIAFQKERVELLRAKLIDKRQ